MSPESGQPVVLGDGGVRRPTRIDVTDTLINEDYIQDLVHDHPQLLPIDEVSPGNGPLVSLGREIASGRGPIDNLLVSPGGELTVVEAKLWRNPEARRKVVAQILDYAAALGHRSYEELDQLVRARNGGRCMWELVAGAGHPAPLTEAQFIDAVSRNLRSGRMLLVIVGDGIREDVEDLAELVGRRPDAAFHLELVELRLFEFSDGERLVIPHMVGRTHEVVRAVVDVRTDASGQVQVNVEPQAVEQSADARHTIRSMDEFLERSATTEPGWSEHLSGLIDWWEEQGGNTSLNQDSVSFSYPYRHARNGLARVLVAYTYGTVEFKNRTLAVELGLFERDQLREDLKARGFGGKDRVNYVSTDVDQLGEVIRQTLMDLLTVIRSADQHDLPVEPTRLPFHSS